MDPSLVYAPICMAAFIWFLWDTEKATDRSLLVILINLCILTVAFVMCLMEFNRLMLR